MGPWSYSTTEPMADGSFTGANRSGAARVRNLDARTRHLICLLMACAVKRRRFPVGARPTRQPLQPEAIGAVMEVTKWLKPSISVSRIGDSASVQAATRVNAEQALYEEGKVKRVVSGGIC